MHKRNHSLDLLKLFFMLIIVIHHLGSWSDYLMNGYICVEFFFMVSGYLVMKKISNNIFSIVDIMKKRLLRLYPHYLLSFIVMFMSVNIYRNGRIDIQQFFSSIPEILLIQNIGVFNGGLNYPCWYLSVMLFSTLIILLLYKLVSKNIFRIIASTCVVLVYSFLFINYQGFEVFSTIYGFYLPFWRGLSGMFVGCLIYEVTENLDLTFYVKNKMTFNFFEFVVLIGIIALLFTDKNVDVLMVIFFVLLMLLALSPCSFIEHISNNYFFTWLSHYEYAIFLNHAFVIGIFNKVLAKYIYGSITQTAILFAILVVYSIFTQSFLDYLSLKLSRDKNEVI